MTTIANIRERLAASVGGEAAFASSFSMRTMRDVNLRAGSALDAGAADCDALLRKVAARLSDAGLFDYRQCSDEELTARYVKKWAAYQNADARTANWMVTGPARFPVERNRKRMEIAQRRNDELTDFFNNAPAWSIERARKARAVAMGPLGIMADELRDLRDRLAERETRQAMMKMENAEARKLKIAQPYAAYQLTNNNAEIRRLQGRVAQVTAKLQAAEQAETSGDEPASRIVAGVEVVENVAEDRLQLIFPGKPSDEMRSTLKSCGFRWSPRNGAWQRQLTNAARYSAERVLSSLEQSACGEAV